MFKSVIKDVIEVVIDENEDSYDIRGRNFGASKSSSKFMWMVFSFVFICGGVVFFLSCGCGDDWN